MLQGLAHTICVYAKKASGGGSDNTPNAVNWPDTSVTFSKSQYQYFYQVQQISGITTSITLQIELSDVAFVELYYKVQSTSTTPALTSPPLSNSYLNILHNGTITISNNQFLVFVPIRSAVGTPTTTVTVKNTSDSNATLDTFTATTRT
jgi:archaellum component FlaF (FlaF/FlaG flagellin family)